MPSLTASTDASLPAPPATPPDHRRPRTSVLAPEPPHRTTAVQVVAVVPAHNEAANIAATVVALLAQNRRPDRVIVVCDNCSDETEVLAAAAGAEVLVTVGNRDKKAGALNQALTGLLPTLSPYDFVLVQDADSVLDPGFISAAVARMQRDPRLGAVGGTFRGQPGGGLVGHLQRNEYVRYARDVRRLKGKCLVVTGTAAVLSVAALWRIRAARLAGTLPSGNGHGGVYDTTVLTEDNELTFALMHVGFRVLSPRECTLTTEVMRTWGDLWRQRLRWKRGAVENCVQYGLTRVTRNYWGRQVFTMAGVLVTAVYLATIAWSLLVYGAIHLQPFWIGVTAVFALERVITLGRQSILRRLVAVTLYELPYDIFLQVCHGKAYLDSLRRTERRW